jgi:hypothetical protein
MADVVPIHHRPARRRPDRVLRTGAVSSRRTYVEILPNPMAPSFAPWDALFHVGSGPARVPGLAAEFAVTAGVCANPDCTCEAVTFAFREAEPAPGAAALAFDVIVDLAGDAAAQTKGLGTQAERLAARVAEALDGATRALPRAALRERRRRLRAIPQTVAGYVRRGEMVPYAHVLAGGLAEDASTYGLLDSVEVGEHDWDVMDHVCARPACNCEEVRLSFNGFDAESGAKVGQFGVRVPLGKGPARFEELSGISLVDAQRVYSDWEASTPHDRRALRVRYDQVRAVAKAAVATPPAPPPVGRREACPCGSGKRFKNCCGRRG